MSRFETGEEVDMEDLLQLEIERVMKDKVWIHEWANGDYSQREIEGVDEAAIKTMTLVQEYANKKFEKALKELNPFDLVVDCKPDCSPEEHAYHEGTWGAHLKLEVKLDEIKKNWYGGKE